MRMKKTVAALLAAAVTVTSAFGAFAATSPVEAPTPGYADTKNAQDHKNNTVTATINKDAKSATVTQATGDKTDAGSSVEFKNARTDVGTKVPVTVVGDGKKGVFDSKTGRNVKTLKINSTASKVTVKANAFKGSKIKTLKVATKKLVLNKNAFKGTKQKKITLKFMSGSKKAANLTVKKGAFKGVTKITVKGLSKKQYKKLVKNLKKAGVKASAIKKG